MLSCCLTLPWDLYCCESYSWIHGDCVFSLVSGLLLGIFIVLINHLAVNWRLEFTVNAEQAI